MAPQKRKLLRKEIGKFSFVGVIATSIDFILLNISMLVFGFPLITSNIIASSVSSVASFTLNRKLTFDGQRHGHTRTIFRYVVIVGISVYIIQNVILYFISDHLKAPIDVVLGGLTHVGIHGLNDTIVSNNLAKIIAVYVGSVWNFLLLRRYVFTPTERKNDDE